MRQVTTIIAKTKKKAKSNLQETLRQVVRGARNDALALEVTAKLEYASCIRAEEETLATFDTASFLTLFVVQTYIQQQQ